MFLNNLYYILCVMTLVNYLNKHVKTRLDALVFGLSLDFKTLNLKPGMRVLLLVWGGG